MEITKFGTRLKPSLPVTIDSLKVSQGHALEEVFPGSWFIAKPKGALGPLWKRLYHAWLVLTNRAIAIQFTRDHAEMAGQDTLKQDKDRKVVAKT